MCVGPALDKTTIYCFSYEGRVLNALVQHSQNAIVNIFSNICRPLWINLIFYKAAAFILQLCSNDVCNKLTWNRKTPTSVVFFFSSFFFKENKKWASCFGVVHRLEQGGEEGVRRRGCAFPHWLNQLRILRDSITEHGIQFCHCLRYVALKKTMENNF